MNVKMTEEKQKETPITAKNETPVGELNAPLWSVVTFESAAVSGLSYAEAVKWMNKLEKQKVSGLCIVTDEAAARISK